MIFIVWALFHAKKWSGVVVASIVTVATFWKTVIYFLVEISSGLEMTRQSLERGDLVGFLMVAVLPNLFWIVFPLAVVITLGRQVYRVGRARRRAARISLTVASARHVVAVFESGLDLEPVAQRIAAGERGTAAA